MGRTEPAPVVILTTWITAGLEIKVFNIRQSWVVILTRDLLLEFYRKPPIAMSYVDPGYPKGHMAITITDEIIIEAWVEPRDYGRVTI